MAHRTYYDTLAYMSNICSTGRITEHSARRGGAQYYHYVLGYNMRLIMRTFRWKDRAEMLNYLGIDDGYNSYDLLGFTSVA